MLAKLTLARLPILLLLICNNTFVNAQWQKTSGPPGMIVNVFYTYKNVLFSGTSPNGIFKSVDNGVTWAASNNGISHNNVFALTGDANYLFAGTDSGIFRSHDNGVSWQPANTGIENKFVVSFVFANGYLFAGTLLGLYKSPDEGNTWSDANGDALNSSQIHDIIYAAPNLVVIADNLIFYSSDNGNGWNYNYRSPFILGSNPSLFATGDSVLLIDGGGIYRSFDGGINWSHFIAINNNTVIDGIVPVNKNIIVAGSAVGMYYSLNFGSSWKAIHAKGLRSGTWLTHDFYRSGKNFLLGYDEIGVGYSADSGRKWNYSLKGFAPAANIDNALAYNGNLLISGTHGDGVYSSTNNGSTWKKIGTTNNADTLSNSNIFAVLQQGNIILAGTCSNGLYRSGDNGNSWAHITNGLPQKNGVLCVQSLAKTNTAFLIGTDQGLYYSTDLGLSWNITNISNKDVVAIAANDSVACAAIASFTGFNLIDRSVNNPAVWTTVFQTSADDFESMASDGKLHFYAGTLLSGNLVSANDGLSWQNVGPGIPNGLGGFTIAALNNNVFIGNNGGLYFSNNYGASFAEANTGFDRNHAVQGLAISSTDIYAGLFENSIWKRPLSDFGITSLQSSNYQLPVSFMPNPLVNESRLTYKLSSGEHVIISIYNQNGNFIKNIKDAIQNAGSYTVLVSKKGFYPGNYFISVIAGKQHAMVNVIVPGN